MKSILLCEGETDQIILSYYFINQFAYSFSEERTKKIQGNVKMGMPCSYVKATKNKRRAAEDELVIWNVGGRDKLPTALEQILKQNSLNADRYYDRLVVISDKDTDEESSAFWENISATIEKSNVKADFVEEDWFKGNQSCQFNTTKTVDFLMLNIPAEGNGALETFLLCALKEHGKAEKYIAQKAQAFVDGLVKNRTKLEEKYLNERRLCTKAPLAVFFGITSPDRVFVKMNEMLEAVNWEQYKTIQQGFEKLNCFGK